MEATSEKEKPYSSRIVVSLFRHGEKEKLPPPGKEGDIEVRLTPGGRKGAMETGDVFRLPEKGMAQAVAKGSLRKRAQETAAFVMAGEQETITGDETLEEMKEKLDRGRKYGSKIGSDPRLDFDGGADDYRKPMEASYVEGRLMDWLVNKSDELAIATHETVGSTYSRMARNIAEILERYLKSAKRFDQLVREKKYADTMQRFLGSHMSVTECFLAKAIEKTKGAKERDKFIANLKKGGFGFVEGYQAEITSRTGAEPRMELHYQKKNDKGDVVFEFHQAIGKEVLDEIIKEGEKLDKATKK